MCPPLTLRTVQSWGGGAGCAGYSVYGKYTPTNCTYALANGTTVSGACYTNTPVNCVAGDVVLPFGSPEFVGEW